MAFKPQPKQPDFDRIKTVLNNARIQDENNALYQTILMLINKVKSFQDLTNKDLASLGNSILEINNTSGGGGGTPAAAGEDYVVVSDGVTPTPLPIDDGFGNFIYLSYTA